MKLVNDHVWTQVFSQVRTHIVWRQGKTLWRQVQNQVWDQIDNQVQNQVWNQLRRITFNETSE